MAQKCEWLVILPDNTGALSKRMEVRPASATRTTLTASSQHLGNLKPDAERGFWAMGGATLDTPPRENEPLSLNGSVMIASAATKEEVLEKLHEDIYATSGVWNMNEIRVYPFKPAFRNAL